MPIWPFADARLVLDGSLSTFLGEKYTRSNRQWVWGYRIRTDWDRLGTYDFETNTELKHRVLSWTESAVMPFEEENGRAAWNWNRLAQAPPWRWVWRLVGKFSLSMSKIFSGLHKDGHTVVVSRMVGPKVALSWINYPSTFSNFTLFSDESFSWRLEFLF